MKTKKNAASSLITIKWFLFFGLITVAFSSVHLIAYTFGTTNNALRFDGSNDYVTFGNPAALGLNTFTVETWFMRQGTGAAVATSGSTTAIPLVTKGRGEADGDNRDLNYFLGIDPATNVLFADFEEGAGGSSPGLNHPISGRTIICNDVWYHAAATYDGTKWQLFLNGELERELTVNQPPRSDSIQGAALGTALNSSGVAGGFFNGTLDEVRIWNFARSAQQIKNNLGVEITSDTGLVGRWGLNEGSGTTTADSSGSGITGTLTNGPTWVTGTPFTLIANGLDLGGSTYVTFGAAPELGAANFTLEGWIKREGTGTTASTGNGGVVAVPIITKGRGEADGDNRDMNYFLGINSSTNVLVADFEDSATGGNHPITGTTPLMMNTWYHVAATYDGTTWRLYLNGNPEGNLAVGQTPRSDSIQHAAIGSALTSTGAASGFFDGVVDEVRIWNVARTQSEIFSNANLEISSAPNLIGRWGFNQNCSSTVIGSAGTTPINGTITGANFAWVAGSPFSVNGNQAPMVNAGADQTITLPANATLSGTATDDGLPNPPGTLTTAWSKTSGPGTVTFGDPNALSTTASFSASGVYVLRLTADDSALNSFDEVTVTVNPQPGDSSLDFGGTNGYVNFGNPAKLHLATFTIETRFRRDGTGATTTTGTGGVPNAIPLVARGRGEAENSNADTNFFLGIDASTNVLAADFEEGAGGTSPSQNHPILGTTVITNNEWHHAAATYDGTKWQLFLDGVLEGELVVGEPVAAAGNQPMSIASALTTGNVPEGFFDGAIDEVRIWDSALTQTQIRTNANMSITSASGLAARWGLNEATGTTTADSTANPANGTITGSNWAWIEGSPLINLVPLVDAGADQTILLTNSATLAGSVNDDGLPNPPNAVTTLWSQISGPGTTTFGNAASLNTTASFSAAGTYVLRLTANDGGKSGSDDITITVNGNTNTVTFQQGVNGYTGTVDTYLRASQSTAPQGNLPEVEWDLDEGTGGGPQYSLVRFDNLFGSGAGQIPSGATITSATLSYTVFDTGDPANVNEVLVDWEQATATFDNFGGEPDVQPDEYGNFVDTATGNSNGVHSIDVTNSLAAWLANPSNNRGWIFRPTAGGGVGFRSSEYATVSERPVLSVTYSANNLPPSVNAGADQSIIFPASANLSGTATDDGEPNPPGMLTTTWSKVSGPGTVTFGDANALSTTAGFSTSGVYVLRLTADDSALTAFDDVTITVNNNTTTLTFRDGENGYNGTIDTYLRESQAGTAQGASATLEWDLNEGSSGPQYALIRFENLFGAGAGQIPSGVFITSATLSYTVFDTGDAASVNEVLVDWDETATFNNFGGEPDVQPDEYGNFISTANGNSNGVHSIDVTNSLIDWYNTPANNRGWIFRPQASDGVDARSSDHGTVSERPILSVTYTTVQPNREPNAPILISPSDGATGVSKNPTLSVDVSDPDGDDLTVTYYGRPVSSTPAPDFTIVALPDTQFYSSELNGGTKEIFEAQTQWIVNERASRNIVFVTQLGDCVQNGDNGGNSIEWDNANGAISKLEDPITTMLTEGIPYGIAVGNHDQSPTGDPNGTTIFYNQYFGEARFLGRSYYGGHYGSNNDNHYQLFSASGMDFIIIHFEYDPSANAAVLAWADNLLQTHSNRRAILVSHHFVNTGNPASFGTQGQATYDALKGNPNLFLMLNGHVNGEGRRQDTFNGNTVYSMLSDYQGRSNGGDGWLRILTFSPATDQIQVQTYSPTLNMFETDADSQFSVSYDMTGSGNNYTVIGTNNNVPGFTGDSVTWNNLADNTTYEWYVTVSDGSITTTGPVWQFTTLAPTSATEKIGGRISFENDTAAAGVTVTLEDSIGNSFNQTTNAQGRYEFPDVEVGSSYVVTPSKAGYTFNPPNKAVFHNGINLDVNFTAVRPASAVNNSGDFDGDGITDLAVFRPSNSVWYLQNSGGSSPLSVKWGISTDLLAPADFDGDGRSDISVYRPSNGTWYRTNSADNTISIVNFGISGDKPVPADFDGDGKADIAVYRPSNGTWYRLNSSDGSFFAESFGLAEDVPTIGDFDGDGKADIAVYRPSNGTWYRLNSSNGSFSAVNFGVSGDKPVPADFDGDGKTDITIFRPSNSVWYRLNSSDGQFTALQWGSGGDIPTPGDFDGDGKADIAVFRPSNGTWYLLNSTQGFQAAQFGTNGDKPIASAFIP